MNDKDGKVLTDHKQLGKKYIPPFTHLLGDFKETSWVKHGLPEFIWISLLHCTYGLQEGTEIAKSFANKCADLSDADPKPIIATLSSFNEINEDAKIILIKYLQDEGMYEKLIAALGGLLSFYPKCPINFLLEVEPAKYQTEDNLNILKKVVSCLFNKESREAVLTLGTAYYLGVLQGRIFIQSDSVLAEFPEIEKYPNTELSMKIASLIRGLSTFWYGSPNEELSKHIWPDYFWNRGLEIEPCTLL